VSLIKTVDYPGSFVVNSPKLTGRVCLSPISLGFFKTAPPWSLFTNTSSSWFAGKTDGWERMRRKTRSTTITAAPNLELEAPCERGNEKEDLK